MIRFDVFGEGIIASPFLLRPTSADLEPSPRLSGDKGNSYSAGRYSYLNSTANGDSVRSSIHLRPASFNLLLDDEKIKVAILGGITTSIRTEEDDLDWICSFLQEFNCFLNGFPGYRTYSSAALLCRFFWFWFSNAPTFDENLLQIVCGERTFD